MNPLAGILLGFAIAAGLVLAGALFINGIRWTVHWGFEWLGRREEANSRPKIDLSAKFCGDCGAGYVKFERRNGFDRATGEPRVISQMACPNIDKSATYQATMVMTMGGRTFPGPFDPDCGDTATTAWQSAQAAHNHDPALVEATCVGCIERMVQSNVMDRRTANDLIASLGA